jgi:hypothetical protein
LRDKNLSFDRKKKEKKKQKKENRFVDMSTTRSTIDDGGARLPELRRRRDSSESGDGGKERGGKARRGDTDSDVDAGEKRRNNNNDDNKNDDDNAADADADADAQARALVDRRPAERRVRRVRRHKPWRKSMAEWSSSSSSGYDYTDESYMYGDLDDADLDVFVPPAELQGPSIHDVIALQKHKAYDRKVQIRNLLILLTAFGSIGLMMAALYVGWDEETRVYDETGLAMTFKFGVTISTGVLLLQITEYYLFQMRHEKSSWFVADSISWRQRILWMYLSELVACGIHTFPEFGYEIYDDRLGAFMFVRCYLLVRVIRDASPIYRKRLEVLNDKFLKRTGAIEFDWLLSVRFVFLGYMWPFVLGGMLFTWFCCAYLIYVLERVARPPGTQAFTLMRSVWMTVATMSTVGYGDESPTAGRAKVMTGLTALFGITETALLVFAVMESLSFSTQDNRVRNIVTRRNILPLRQEMSAKYIALHWQIFKLKRTAIEMGKTGREIAHETKSHGVQNTHFKTTLRALRRELSAAMELDDIVIARLDEKLGNWTGYFALRLARLLGVKRKEERPYPIPPIPVMNHRIERIALRQAVILEKMNQLQVAVLGHDTDVKVRRRKDAGGFFEASLFDSLFGLS